MPLFYGLAGDIRGVTYVWPEPVPIIPAKFLKVVLSLNVARCAADRGITLPEGHLGVIPKRVQFVPGTVYSEFYFIFLFAWFIFSCWLSVLAPFEHYDFIMEGLVRLRRATRKLWPDEAKWKWAFHPEFLLSAEFALWVEGQFVPPTRSFTSSDVYLVYSPCHTFSDVRKASVNPPTSKSGSRDSSVPRSASAKRVAGDDRAPSESPRKKARGGDLAAQKVDKADKGDGGATPRKPLLSSGLLHSNFTPSPTSNVVCALFVLFFWRFFDRFVV